jgi:Xaa-Pro aminopeptidase
MSDLNIYKARRAEVAKRMEDNSILILSSSKLVSRNNDTTFPFRQDSNFFYLTGFQEPDSVLIVIVMEGLYYSAEKKIQI